MKALTLIPEKIKKMYCIKKVSRETINGVKIPYVTMHDPACVNVDITDDFKVENDNCVVSISNEKVLITLWKSHKRMHVMVFSNLPLS